MIYYATQPLQVLILHIDCLSYIFIPLSKNTQIYVIGIE